MPAKNSSDLLLTAGSVLGAPGADSVLVSGGRIRAIGTAAGLTRPGLPAASHSGVIAPAMCDAHLHPIGHAAALHRPSLMGAADFADLQEILSGAAASQSAGTAVSAMRLDDESLAEGRLPDRHVLDRAVPAVPVFAVRYCGHIAVANTAALRLAGIGPDTPDPEGGVIDRDDRGIPTGVLRETATELVSAALGSLAPPVTAEDLVEAGASLASLGLASVGGIVDIREGCWAGAGSELDVLLEAAADFPIRVAAFVVAHTPRELGEAAGRLGTAGQMVRFAGLKVFADGSLGGHTAALHEPFSDRPDRTGTNRLDPDWAFEMASFALQLGGRVAVHAIGDAANGMVLDLMAGLIGAGADPAMLRIEHASLLSEADLDRFADLGITAVVQPAFLASEVTWLETRVGPERIERTYAFRSLADRGVPLAGSSDCPVEPPHPLWGMAAARDRCGLTPAQRLDAAEAFDLFTTGAAGAIGETRSLQVGSPADLVVMDVDPVESTPDGLRDASVAATYVAGVPIEFPAIAAWPG